jgi:hypothetical protein
MPQQDTTLGEVPTPPVRVPDDSIDLSAGVVKKTSKKDDERIDLSAGLVPRKGKTGAAPTEEAKSNYRKIWSTIWTPTMSSKAATQTFTFGLYTPEKIEANQKELARLADEAKKNGHPLAAAYDDLLGYVNGANKAGGEFLAGLTSPGQVGLTLATAGESALSEGAARTMGTKILSGMARLPGRAAGVYFGYQGLNAALTPQQPGENRYDSFWRRSLGASAFLGTVYSEGSAIKRAVPKFIQHYFGLSDDLSEKINSQVKQITEARNRREGNIAAIDSDTRQKISDLRSSLQQQIGDINAQTHSAVQSILTQTERVIEENKDKLTDVQKQSLREGSRTVADTMQAFVQEKARVSAPFDRIAAQIPGVVAESAEIQGIVDRAFKDSGVDPKEAPPRATALLKVAEHGEEGPAGVELRGPDGKTQFVNEKYVQGWVDRGYRRVGSVIGEGGLDFERLTRIREDLGQSAEAAKDTGQKRALFKARDDVTDLQEKIANKKGQGDAYGKAKQDYTEFVRGIGSDMVHTFLDASDAEAQTMAPKIRQFMQNREIGDGLRGVLKAAGVDVEPLDKLLDAQNALEETNVAAERLKNIRTAEAEKTWRAAVSEARKTAAEDVGETKTYAKERKGEEKAALKEEVRKAKATEIRGKKTIKQLFGKDADELSGADRQRLQEMLIREQMNRASAGGMGQWAYWTLGYGLLKLGMGSPFGAPGVLIGGARIKLPSLLMKPEVQDWVIRQSGIDPNTPAGIRARRGLTHLQRILRSGVPQVAAGKAAEHSFGELPAR